MQKKSGKISQFDVAIIGGGVTGLFLAYLLGDEGWNVILLEKKKNVSDGVLCAGVVSEDWAFQFQIPEHLRIKKIERITLVTESGKNYRVKISNSPGLLIDRVGLNLYLKEKASEKGSIILCRAPVACVEEDFNGVRIYYARNGTNYLLKSRIAFIATGSDVSLIKRCNLEPPPFQFSGFHGIYASGEDGNADATVFYFPTILGSGFGWIVPEGNNAYRTGIFAPGNVPFKTFNEFSRRVGLDGNWKRLPGKRRINQGLSPRMASDRVALVGEAAGAVKTTTGGGISYGMRSAVLASEIASQALKRNRSLKHFHELMWREFQSEINTGIKLRKFIGNLPLSKVEQMADFVVGNGIMKMLLKAFQFDFHSKAIETFFSAGTHLSTEST